MMDDKATKEAARKTILRLETLHAKNKNFFNTSLIGKAIDDLKKLVNKNNVTNKEILTGFKNKRNEIAEKKSYEWFVKECDDLLLACDPSKDLSIDQKQVSSTILDQSFPSDIKLETFKYLDYKSLGAARLVCSEWNKLISDNLISKTKPTRIKNLMQDFPGAIAARVLMVSLDSSFTSADINKFSSQLSLSTKSKNVGSLEAFSLFNNELSNGSKVGKKIDFDIWKNVGSWKSITNGLIKYNMVVICIDGSVPEKIVDMDNTASRIKRLKDLIKDISDGGKQKLPIILACTKLDDSKFKWTPEKGQQWAKDVGADDYIQCGTGSNGFHQLRIAILTHLNVISKEQALAENDVEEKTTEFKR